MQSKYLKHVVSSGLVAVFAGVLAFSFDTAYGNNSVVPSSNPPGTGVSPTFNALNVKGSTDLQNTLTNTSTSNNGAVTVNDQFTVKSKTNLEGQVVNEGTFYSGNVYINDALQIVGKALFQDNVFFDGDYIYLGASDGNSEIYARGEIIMAGPTYESKTIRGLREITGTLGNDTLWLSAGGGNVVLELKPGTSRRFNFNAPLAGTSVDPLVLADNVDINGFLNLLGMVQNNGANYGGAVWINDDFSVSGTTELSDAVRNSGAKNGGALLLDDDVKVTGKLDVAEYISTAYSYFVTTGVHSATASCPEESPQLISCGINFSSSGMNYVKAPTVYPSLEPKNGITPTNPYCKAEYMQTSANIVGLDVIALCM